MPELPEVETMVRGIRSHVEGQRITAFAACPCACRPLTIEPPLSQIARAVVGETQSVRRAGAVARRRPGNAQPAPWCDGGQALGVAGQILGHGRLGRSRGDDDAQQDERGERGRRRVEGDRDRADREAPDERPASAEAVHERAADEVEHEVGDRVRGDGDRDADGPGAERLGVRAGHGEEREVVDEGEEDDGEDGDATGAADRGGGARFRALVQSGVYGKLLVSKGYCCKPRWSIGFKPVKDPPATLDFDLWLGPDRMGQRSP